MSGRLLQIVTTLDDAPELATMARVSRRMAAEGMRVGVLSLTGGGSLAAELRRNGAQVFGLDRPVRNVAQRVYRVRRLVQWFRPDVVHTWDSTANRWGRVVAATSHVPVLIASYGIADPRQSWWMKMTSGRLDRYTQACVVNTDLAYAEHDPRGQGPSKLRLIRDGVPVRARGTIEHRVAIRTRLQLSPDAKLVGVLAPLEPAQRIKDAIWATDLLRVFHPELYLLVIGSGPDRWRLERFVLQVQNRRRTLLLGQRSDWMELISALDCLCQPGGRLVTPVGILEALAVGTPVVATQTLGHRELIDPHRTGLLVPLGDRGAMARQIHRVMEDVTLAQRLIGAGQQWVRSRHAEEEMLSRYGELYRADLTWSLGPRAVSGSASSVDDRPGIP